MTDKDRDLAADDSDKAEIENAEDTSNENSDSDEITAKIEELQQKADDNWNKFVRSQAEMENLRKRAKKDVEQAHKYAVEKFVAELIPVKESLDLGLAAAQEEGVDIEKIKEGTDLTIKMMDKLFCKFSIEEVNPLGEKFNPECHQAMTMQPSDEQPANTVLHVIQKGYTLNGRIVKPALVVVSKGSETKPSDDGEQTPSIDEKA